VSLIGKTAGFVAFVVFTVLLFWLVEAIANRIAAHNWDYFDRYDLRVGLAWSAAAIAAGPVLVAMHMPILAVLVLAAVAVFIPYYFVTGSTNDYVLFVKRGKLHATWKGPGSYMVARSTKVTIISLVGQSVSFMDDPIQALSADRIMVDIKLLAAFAVTPEGDDAVDPEAFRKKLHIMGDNDKIKARVRPLVEMAARDAIGQMCAMEAATVDRDLLRQQIFENAAPLMAGAKTELKAIILQMVDPQDGVREAELQMRDHLRLEEAMGPIGLAVHRQNNLARAGIVVLPTGPAIYGSPGVTPIPATPPPSTPPRRPPAPGTTPPT
jgi:regulator of protease activity HflC (stomatin/prohibitin superfamily)